MREPLKDKHYFEYALAEISESIDDSLGYIERKEERIKDWSTIYLCLYSDYLRQIFILYSMGSPVEQLVPLAEKAIEYYLKCENDPNAEEDLFKDFIGNYEAALHLVCIGLLFDVDSVLLAELRETFLNKKGKDLLIDQILSKKIEINIVSKKVHYPKLYEKLIDLDGLVSEDRSETIVQYMEDWYKVMKKTDWHGDHKSSAINEASSFVGYWAIEAAAIVYIYGIDDSRLQEMPYYPKDLVHFAQNNIK